mmetsp:Transcript_9107/g.27292  ORF Transcript_9107/g.27292 Transcript_9107/m.27292 type:complete len:227 (-) Transcript_9107:859-1539(-)
MLRTWSSPRWKGSRKSWRWRPSSRKPSTWSRGRVRGPTRVKRGTVSLSNPCPPPSRQGPSRGPSCTCLPGRPTLSCPPRSSCSPTRRSPRASSAASTNLLSRNQGSSSANRWFSPSWNTLRTPSHPSTTFLSGSSARRRLRPSSAGCGKRRATTWTVSSRRNTWSTRREARGWGGGKGPSSRPPRRRTIGATRPRRRRGSESGSGKSGLNGSGGRPRCTDTRGPRR